MKADYIDTATINGIRLKNHNDLLPKNDRSFIEKISKVLIKEYGWSEGVGALLTSNGIRRWRLYEINKLDIDADYNKIVTLVVNGLRYAPSSCRNECTINDYTGAKTCTTICEEGKDLRERLAIINNESNDADTDRWREQWDVEQSYNISGVRNTKQEDQLLVAIQNAKNKY